MMSFGPELLVIEMMGVIGSNWRINDVAETPASFNLHDISLKLCTHRDHKPHGLVQEELAVKVGHHNVLSPKRKNPRSVSSNKRLSRESR